MVDTGTVVNGHKVFSVTLSSTDYPEGGFYRVIFQYFVNGNWDSQIFAFGGGGYSGADIRWTAIDQLAGKRFSGNDLEGENKDQSYNPTQWTRVEYYYKDTPLYFKNASNADLANVTAVFYKKGTDGTVETTTSLPIGTVEAGSFTRRKS